MNNWCSNRLTVIGPKAQLQRFRRTRWHIPLDSRHEELLENSPGRFACQFETDTPPLEPLRRLSRRWLKLVFLLDFEVEAERSKGLAKAKGGALEKYRLTY